ncbi:nose resistant to fluoxetine protein 6-like [Athalia rosae]|uniref:nose resistant to fluoxetine protein 6-like n=1 Tax=Athalia rosae TaxID=37344 RepID=UPI0020333152|nr:nose resistant to fluoxetine protein 6-like [Athalia rosae]
MILVGQLLSIILLVGLIQGIKIASAVSENVNVSKPQPSEKSEKAQVEVVYENHGDDMLPVLSRDLTLLGHAIEMIDNEDCRNQCKLMMSGIRNLTSWAVKFYDASGKFPEGVLGGSLYQLGNFDECLQIGQSDDAPPGVYGQYCLGEVGIGVPNLYLDRNGTIWDDFRPSNDRSRQTITKLHWGICVPSVCQPQEVEKVVRTVLAVAFSGSRLKLTPRIPEKSCYKQTTAVYSPIDIVYTCALISLTFVLIFGTAFHIKYLVRSEEVPGGYLPQSLLAFSVIYNFKKLRGGTRSTGINLDCISGIKVTAMIMIIAGHSLIFVISGPVLNINFWQYAVTKVENAVFLNNPLLVDTFLLLSGFLVSCILLNELNKGKRINFINIYVMRYVRLTPAYILIIGLYLTWFPRMDSGPMWSRVYLERDRCMTSWWANLLYINNYVNTDKLCMFQSWYLSVDTQLFILAPFMIYPLHRWPKIGESILATATALSILVPFVITIRNSADPTLMVYSAELKDISTNNFFLTNYIKTHMRASSYCFGLACGYIVHRIHLSGHKLSNNTVRMGWILASLSLIGSLLSITIFYGPRRNFTPIEAAIYASLHRAFWSLGTAWVVLACVTGNGGVVAKILQWKPFLPLSRLTYSAYLVNGMVELHSVATTRSPQYLNNFSLTRQLMAHLTVTFMGALILSMACESPMLGLEKIVLSGGRKNNKNDKKDESEETNATDA